MREIKFKGKRKNGPEILIGDLNNIHGQIFIFSRGEDTPCNSTDWFEVDPETVGMFTGIQDKKGFDIFEGDIVADADNTFIIRFGNYEDLDGWECIGFYCEWPARPNRLGHLSFTDGPYFTVVGNIHESPDFFKKA
jgi:uncharacterized phage protein (TIGR01671 family)